MTVLDQSNAIPPWLSLAITKLGIAEIPGPKHNPDIIAFHATTTLKATSDEVPWCAAFINWTVTKSGFKWTNSARARDGLKAGVDVGSYPPYGSIVIMSRGKDKSQGHIGIFLGFSSDKKRISVLSGNYGDKVCIEYFMVSSVLGYRWPK